MTLAARSLALAATVALAGCVEDLALTPPLEAFEMPGDDALAAPPTLHAVEPQLPLDLGVAGEEIPAEVEEAPERVEWVLSEASVRNYVEWQRHLEDAQSLAEVAGAVVEGEEHSEELRALARRYAEPEPAAESFARFGLKREEVAHLEELATLLGELRERPSPVESELRKRGGSDVRRFLDELDRERDRSFHLQADGLRAAFGDANVDLVLRYRNELPAFPVLVLDGWGEEPQPGAEDVEELMHDSPMPHVD